MKQVSEEALLGAVICLSAPRPEKDSEQDKDSEQEKEKEKEKEKQKDVPIGILKLSRLSPELSHHRNTELGIDILPAYQGRGYGREAIEWALEYAFVRVGLHRMSVRAFEWNEGAVRLYQRIGFKVEGRMREELWHAGRWWDGVELGMLEGEWRELREKKDLEEGR